MTTAFITIAQAVQLTGKSRRTIQRLVEALVKSQPERVMKEKTDRGYIWKVSEQSVRQAYGGTGQPAPTARPLPRPQVSAPVVSLQPEKYLEVIGQGYSGMMAMHEEVKQQYEKRLQEKDEQITALTQALTQARRGLWARVFGD